MNNKKIPQNLINEFKYNIPGNEYVFINEMMKNLDTMKIYCESINKIANYNGNYEYLYEKYMTINRYYKDLLKYMTKHTSICTTEEHKIYLEKNTFDESIQDKYLAISSDIIKKNIYNNIISCINNNKKYIIIPLKLYFSNIDYGSHINYVFIDNINNTIELFEPHGYNISGHYKQVLNSLELFFIHKFPKYKFKNINYCYNLGVQSIIKKNICLIIVLFYIWSKLYYPRCDVDDINYVFGSLNKKFTIHIFYNFINYLYDFICYNNIDTIYMKYYKLHDVIINNINDKDTRKYDFSSNINNLIRLNQYYDNFDLYNINRLYNLYL